MEVTFEIGPTRVRPSAAVLGGMSVALPCYHPLSHDEVERLAGRPVLRFPYGLYTKALAEAVNGQPAVRMLDLLVEMGLACPAHGPSRYGDYCSVWCDSYIESLGTNRTWRVSHAPRRHGDPGLYLGTRREWWAMIELSAASGRQREIPVYGLSAAGVEWGYSGSGPEEGARCLLADYIGFLPQPTFRGVAIRAGMPVLHADADFATIARYAPLSIALGPVAQ